MTYRARAALDASDVIVGYASYIDLVKAEYPNKELLSTPMRKEVDRCRAALEAAAGGRTVAMVCSGDPGIYGMAGLLLELAGDHSDVRVEVVPGVSAANGGAALLGAPLMHDWCSISLSDLMTPWELIERRLEAAATADFCICLYNPASHGRPDHLRHACDVLLRHLPAETVCGIARGIGREGERAEVTTLRRLRDVQADMLTCVFVGNSQTRAVAGRMVTPRGYLQREA
jgi:precorrin-3B C17-methyltransferase